MFTVALTLTAAIVLGIVAVLIGFALGARQMRRHCEREAVRTRLSRLTGVAL